MTTRFQKLWQTITSRSFQINRPRYFRNTFTLKAGITDFRKIIITVSKSLRRKQKQNIIRYRNLENLKRTKQEELKNELLTVGTNKPGFSYFSN